MPQAFYERHDDVGELVLDAPPLNLFSPAKFDDLEAAIVQAQESSPRALRTPLIDRLGADPESVDPATAGPELLAALREDRAHEYIPFAGQSAALVHDIKPAAEILRELVAGAEAALERALSSRAAS